MLPRKRNRSESLETFGDSADTNPNEIYHPVNEMTPNDVFAPVRIDHRDMNNVQEINGPFTMDFCTRLNRTLNIYLVWGKKNLKNGKSVLQLIGIVTKKGYDHLEFEEYDYAKLYALKSGRIDEYLQKLNSDHSLNGSSNEITASVEKMTLASNETRYTIVIENLSSENENLLPIEDFFNYLSYQQNYREVGLSNIIVSTWLKELGFSQHSINEINNCPYTREIKELIIMSRLKDIIDDLLTTFAKQDVLTKIAGKIEGLETLVTLHRQLPKFRELNYPSSYILAAATQPYSLRLLTAMAKFSDELISLKCNHETIIKTLSSLIQSKLLKFTDEDLNRMAGFRGGAANLVAAEFYGKEFLKKFKREHLMYILSTRPSWLAEIARVIKLPNGEFNESVVKNLFEVFESTIARTSSQNTPRRIHPASRLQPIIDVDNNNNTSAINFPSPQTLASPFEGYVQNNVSPSSVIPSQTVADSSLEIQYNTDFNSALIQTQSDEMLDGNFELLDLPNIPFGIENVQASNSPQVLDSSNMNYSPGMLQDNNPLGGIENSVIGTGFGLFNTNNITQTPSPQTRSNNNPPPFRFL